MFRYEKCNVYVNPKKYQQISKKRKSPTDVGLFPLIILNAHFFNEISEAFIILCF